MYIQPNSTIMLLHNVPLDSTYTDAIYFDSATAQYNYFAGLVKRTFNNQTYQRVNKGSLRVQVSADDVYDCNYLMFRNTNYGSKWFYAFIEHVNYINDNTTEIEYTLDVLQTWHFDYTLDQSYIARTHTTSDNIGEHIEPEPVALGEYVMNNYGQEMDLSTPCVIIAVADTEGETSDGNTYNAIYSGAKLYAFGYTDNSGIDAFLSNYIQKPDSIINMYMCPIALIGGAIPSGNELPQSLITSTFRITHSGTSEGQSLNGYVPKNNKLYTYPYNFYRVDNSLGNNINIRYEFWSGNTLEIYGTIGSPVQVVLRPINYKGSGVNTLYNAESLTIANYPMCSWNFDAYKAWVAQNSIPTAISYVGSAVNSAAGGFVAGGPVGAALGTIATSISSITNYMSQEYRASIAADLSAGNFNSSNANFSRFVQQFYGGRCSITAQYARRIDDFFTMFGYAIGRVMTPNRTARPHWTYIQTVDCKITGSVPVDDMDRIKRVYDSGVTWWRNGSEVGNYSLDNSV